MKSSLADVIKIEDGRGKYGAHYDSPVKSNIVTKD
jgi:hypothetical protein